MLEVFRWSPKQKSVGDVSFGQIWIHLQRATAVKLRLFQPYGRRVKLEMASRTHKRKGRMCEGETWISRDRIAQPLLRFLQQRWVAGRAKPIAAHEFCISQRIFAISRALAHRP